MLVASKKGDGRFRPAFVASLKKEGLEVKELELKGKGTALEAAKKAVVMFGVSLSFKPGKKEKGSVKIDVFDTATGQKLKAHKAAWKSAKEAAKLGSDSGELVAGAILAALANPAEAAGPERVPLVQPKPIEPVADVTPTAKIEPKPDVIADPIVRSSADAELSKTKSARAFVLGLEAGSQAATSYSVSVGDTSTRLTYALSPLLLLGVRGRLAVDPVAISFDVAVVPVRYALDIDPPITPADPSGLFFAGAAEVVLPVALSGEGDRGVRFVPGLGFGLELLSVEEQSQPVVIGASALGPHVAVGLEVLGADLDLGVKIRGRWLLSYSEAPVKTGEFAGGFGLEARGDARYWVADSLALTFGVGFRMHSVSMSGAGDRLRLQDDPELVDASVGGSSLGLSFGVAYAL